MRYVITILSVLMLGISSASAQSVRSEKSSSVVTIEGESYYVHTVLPGETLYSLRRLYGVSEDDIVRANPHVAYGLQAEQVVKVPMPSENLSSRKQARLFDTHIVNQGETLYAISRRYEIPVTTLIEDNDGLDPAHLSPGQTINIRKKSVGDATPAQIERQMEDYRDAINVLSDDYEYHFVLMGETLYSLSRRYGVTEGDLVALNDLQEGLKAGALIKVRRKGEDPAKFEAVTDSINVAEQEARDLSMREDASVREYLGSKPVEIAMLLPLSDNTGRNYVEFYQGAMLALEDIRNQGVSVKMELYDTNRSADEVRRIVHSDDFGSPEIIIGPVFEESMRPAVGYAQANGAAMVSPIRSVKETVSPVLYQMPADADSKYDKLKELFTPGRNVVYVGTAYKDGEIENSVRPMLPDGCRAVNYNTTMRIEQGLFEQALDPSGDNIVVVSCTNEMVADQILSAISSYQSNLVARSQMRGTISVLGGSGWREFNNIADKNLFFKLRVCYLSAYHADRGDQRVRDFDSRFINAYADEPSLFAYRGYDAVKLFVGAANTPGADFTAKLNDSDQQLLQMPYRFVQKEQAGTFVNDQWGLVCYGSDYTITVK